MLSLALALFASALPLGALADVTIVFQGLHADGFQPGCAIVSRDAGTKTSIVRCKVADLPETGGAYTYSEAYGVPTSDRVHYGGCGVRMRVRAGTRANPVFDADVTGSHNFACTLHWTGHDSVDVRYTLR